VANADRSRASSFERTNKVSDNDLSTELKLSQKLTELKLSQKLTESMFSASRLHGELCSRDAKARMYISQFSIKTRLK
jgi:hypothetical protein